MAWPRQARLPVLANLIEGARAIRCGLRDVAPLDQLAASEPDGGYAARGRASNPVTPVPRSEPCCPATSLRGADVFPRGAPRAGPALLGWLVAGALPLAAPGLAQGSEQGPEAQSPEGPSPDAQCPPLQWVAIPAGTGPIGQDRSPMPFDAPRWTVTFTQPFELLATEATVCQVADKVDGYQASTGRPTMPATGLIWSEARDFCVAIGGRLPTEIEWEYAAWAGSTTKWWCGDDPACLEGVAWIHDTSPYWQVQPVGELRPNPWGLYDVHGNVAEWTGHAWRYRRWREHVLGHRLTTDPPAVSDGEDPTDGPNAIRPLRGGSAWDGPEQVRSARRSWMGALFRDAATGVRCARGIGDRGAGSGANKQDSDAGSVDQPVATGDQGGTQKRNGRAPSGGPP